MRKIATALATSTLLALVWIGCGTDNGDPEVDAGTAAPRQKYDAGNTEPDLDSGSAGEDASTGEPDASTGDGGGNPPPVCNDTDDAGGSEAAAKVLPVQSDCDGQVTKAGVANGIIDRDFYKFAGTDNFGFGCVVGATAGTTAADLEVCMFVKCKTGDTEFQGCTKGTAATSEIGTKGCCTNSPGTVELDYNCGGTTDEGGDFFMRVKARVDKCIPYTLSYGL